MLISTSKLLKEPLNRTTDVFPYFIYIFLFHFYLIIVIIMIIFSRTFRTLDFDLEKRYLYIHFLLLFNILIVVDSC